MKRGQSSNAKAQRKRARERREKMMGDAGPDHGLAPFIRTRPCLGCGKGPCDVAHIRTRGAGHGTRDRDGVPNVVPLCRHCHSRQESNGWGVLGMTETLARTAARQVREQWEEFRGS